jgi:hypothetical protein
MDIKSIKKAAKESMTPGLPAYEAVMAVRDSLEAYYDNDALSCIFAPLFPDHARNNLWVCRKPVK